MAKSKKVRSHKGRSEKLQALAREKFEGLTAGEAVKKAGVSNATYHRWKNALWDAVSEADLNPSVVAAAEAKASGKKESPAAAGKKKEGETPLKNGKSELSMKDRLHQLEEENLKLRLTIADMAVEAHRASH